MISRLSEQPILRALGITKHYGGIHAVRGVGLGIGPGKIHALMGENGAPRAFLQQIFT
ncbi:hypothetical protein BH23CHL4_BH23CHL4_29930 [soil metagenome]